VEPSGNPEKASAAIPVKLRLNRIAELVARWKRPTPT